LRLFGEGHHSVEILLMVSPRGSKPAAATYFAQLSILRGGNQNLKRSQVYLTDLNFDAEPLEHLIPRVLKSQD